ncbi:hypothetical protein O181_127447, partial [Austropuccinia psidii MF-1]|nr:hypothetical protein [Austropuccinia psidii MF-1]
MCPCYAEMNALFGNKPNVNLVASYDSQEKDSLNGDDDDVLSDKENNGLESSLNVVPLVQAENLQDESRNQALTPNLNDKSGSRKRPMDMFAPTYANLLESRQK